MIYRTPSDIKLESITPPPMLEIPSMIGREVIQKIIDPTYTGSITEVGAVNIKTRNAAGENHARVTIVTGEVPQIAYAKTDEIVQMPPKLASGTSFAEENADNEYSKSKSSPRVVRRQVGRDSEEMDETEGENQQDKEQQPGLVKKKLLIKRDSMKLQVQGGSNSNANKVAQPPTNNLSQSSMQINSQPREIIVQNPANLNPLKATFKFNPVPINAANTTEVRNIQDYVPLPNRPQQQKQAHPHQQQDDRFAHMSFRGVKPGGLGTLKGRTFMNTITHSELDRKQYQESSKKTIAPAKDRKADDGFNDLLGVKGTPKTTQLHQPAQSPNGDWLI